MIIRQHSGAAFAGWHPFFVDFSRARVLPDFRAWPGAIILGFDGRRAIALAERVRLTEAAKAAG
jgi:hypothetical protein